MRHFSGYVTRLKEKTRMIFTDIMTQGVAKVDLGVL